MCSKQTLHSYALHFQALNVKATNSCNNCLFNRHNFYPYPVQVCILLLVRCAFKRYVECLYRHIFLEDTCTNIKVTKKSAPQVLTSRNWHIHGLENTKLGLWVLKANRYDILDQIHKVLCCWKVIRLVFGCFEACPNRWPITFQQHKPHESAQLRVLRTDTPSLVFWYQCMHKLWLFQTWGAVVFVTLMWVHVYSMKI